MKWRGEERRGEERRGREVMGGSEVERRGEERRGEEGAAWLYLARTCCRAPRDQLVDKELLPPEPTEDDPDASLECSSV